MIDGIETQPRHLLYLPAGRQVSLNSRLLSSCGGSPLVSGLICYFCPPDRVLGRLSSQLCTPASSRSAGACAACQTPPHYDALLSRRSPAEGACLRLVVYAKHIYRGLSPHKFTPMPGVHKVAGAYGDRVSREAAVQLSVS